jgi:hypothetical protein
VAVEVVTGPVVAPGSAGIGVAHGVLNVLERHAGTEKLGGEAVAEAVRAQLAGGGDAGLAGQVSSSTYPAELVD